MDPTNTEASNENDRALKLDPRNLKGLAHPLRVRLLGALREFGPSTATALAARLGESSGATSYHLRQLASFGFIEEDLTRTSRKERWWRASHPMTQFDERSFGAAPEAALLGAEFLRAIAGAHADRMVQWIAALPDSAGPWRYAGGISDWALRLTPEELERLSSELEEVIGRYRRFDPEEPDEPGRMMVAVQLQLLPNFSHSDDHGRK